MKKILVACAFLFVAATGYSQLFNIGIKLGYNTSLTPSSINSDLHYTSKNAFDDIINNFHVGAFGRVYFKNLYLQPEVLYSRQKKTYTFDENGIPSDENSIAISAIDVPILLGYRILNFKVGNLRAYAGPKFRFNAGSKIKFDDQSEDYLVPDAAKVGLDVGIGADILMLTFDVRYGLVGNLYDTPANIKNGLSTSTFIFSLGWKIF